MKMRAFLVAVTVAIASSRSEAANLFTDSGVGAASIQGTVDAFRDALGQLNAPEPVQLNDGRRQINWDAAPDFISAPNAFPGDFFNFSAAPRARGIEFTTPGSGFQLSATAASGEGIEFDNLQLGYSDLFDTFSPERLFTSIDSYVTYAHFFSAADQATPARTKGFGAVFTDVDTEMTSYIEYYDVDGVLLETAYAPAESGDETLSFAGAVFDEAIVSYVKIYSGTAALGSGVEENLGMGVDLVALDDFIYGEPVPEPVGSALVAAGVIAATAFRRR